MYDQFYFKNMLTRNYYFNGCTCEKGENVNIEREFSVHQVGDAELTSAHRQDGQSVMS